MINLKLYPYFKVLHPYTSIAVAILTMIFSLPLTDKFKIFSLFLVGLSMLSVQFTIGLTNDLFDQNFDRIAKPWKPLVNGTTSIYVIYLILAILLLIAIFSVLPFGYPAIIILFFGLFLGLIYNLGFKRTIYSWLPYSFAIPTILVFARVVHSNPNLTILILLYPLGLLAGPALNIANQLPGSKEARLSGEYSLVHKLGEKKAEKISIVLLMLLIAITGLFLLILDRLDFVSSTSLIIAIFLTLIYILAIRKNLLILAWPFSILTVSFIGFTFLPSFYGF